MFDPKLVQKYAQTIEEAKDGARVHGVPRIFARPGFGEMDDHGAETARVRDAREERIAWYATYLRDQGFAAPRALAIAGAMVDGTAYPNMSDNERAIVSQVPVGNSAPATNKSQRDGSSGAYKPKQPSPRAPVAGIPNSSARFNRSADLDQRLEEFEKKIDCTFLWARACK